MVIAIAKGIQLSELSTHVPAFQQQTHSAKDRQSRDIRSICGGGSSSTSGCSQPNFSARDYKGLVSRDPTFMNKPFYLYDFMALTCSAQFSKIKLRATCFWLREAFCKDSLCLYPHIRNTRIIFQQGVEGFLQNSHQIDSFRKETAYVAGMC